jgi:YgiT-type zinc finger domain-containing protein
VQLAIITAYNPDPGTGSEDFQAEENVMECPYCKGMMEKRTAPFSIDRNGYHIAWHALPACVCAQCGEAFFEREEVGRIQKALRAVDVETEPSSAAA